MTSQSHIYIYIYIMVKLHRISGIDSCTRSSILLYCTRSINKNQDNNLKYYWYMQQYFIKALNIWDIPLANSVSFFPQVIIILLEARKEWFVQSSGVAFSVQQILTIGPLISFYMHSLMNPWSSNIVAFHKSKLIAKA